MFDSRSRTEFIFSFVLYWRKKRFLFDKFKSCFFEKCQKCGWNLQIRTIPIKIALCGVSKRAKKWYIAFISVLWETYQSGPGNCRLGVSTSDARESDIIAFVSFFQAVARTFSYAWRICKKTKKYQCAKMMKNELPLDNLGTLLWWNTRIMTKFWTASCSDSIEYFWKKFVAQ